jgi:hypothetical protein
MRIRVEHRNPGGDHEVLHEAISIVGARLVRHLRNGGVYDVAELPGYFPSINAVRSFLVKHSQGDDRIVITDGAHEVVIERDSESDESELYERNKKAG